MYPYSVPCFFGRVAQRVRMFKLWCRLFRTPLVGFLRFLKLLSTHDWTKEPLIVNLNNEFTGWNNYININNNNNNNNNNTKFVKCRNAVRRLQRLQLCIFDQNLFESPVQMLIRSSCAISWRRSSVVRTLVFGRRTFPALRPIYGWQVTTLWVNCPLWVSLPTRPTQPSDHASGYGPFASTARCQFVRCDFESVLWNVQSRTLSKSEQHSHETAPPFLWCLSRVRSTDGLSCGPDGSRRLHCCNALRCWRTRLMLFYCNWWNMAVASPTSRWLSAYDWTSVWRRFCIDIEVRGEGAHPLWAGEG